MKLHEHLTRNRCVIEYFTEESPAPASADMAYCKGPGDASDYTISARIVIRELKAAHTLYHEQLHTKIWLKEGFEFQRQKTPFSECYMKVVGNAIDHLWMGQEEIQVYPEATNYWLSRLKNSLLEVHRFSPKMKNLSKDVVTTTMAKWVDFYSYRNHPDFQSHFEELNEWYRHYHLLKFLEPLAKKLEGCAPVYRMAYAHFEEATTAYREQKPTSRGQGMRRQTSTLLSKMMARKK